METESFCKKDTNSTHEETAKPKPAKVPRLKQITNEITFARRQRLRKKVFLEKKIDRYVESFTVHGLTKVFTGGKIESIIWATMLIGGIILTTVIIRDLVSKFLNYGIYIEIHSQITDQNYFPSVTFCDNRMLVDAYFSYCGVPSRLQHKNPTGYCKHRMRGVEASNTSNNVTRWSNGLFTVTQCRTWGGKECANKKYFKSLSRYNNSCITWNYKGDLHDVYSHVDIELKVENFTHFGDVPPEIIAIPHDPDVFEIDVTSKVDLSNGKTYEIKLDKTVIKRMPAPYPSKCTHSKHGDIFPGKYTRRGCIESHNFIEMFKKCGDTFDYVRQFIPSPILQSYSRNETIEETLDCIRLHIHQEIRKIKECAFPCEDLDLGIASIFREAHVKDGKTYRVSIQHQSVDTYKVMQEKELYSWYQLASELGGVIGLVIGGSVMSLFEILAYIALVITKNLLR